MIKSKFQYSLRGLLIFILAVAFLLLPFDVMIVPSWRVRVNLGQDSSKAIKVVQIWRDPAFDEHDHNEEKAIEDSEVVFAPRYKRISVLSWIYYTCFNQLRGGISHSSTEVYVRMALKDEAGKTIWLDHGSSGISIDPKKHAIDVSY